MRHEKWTLCALEAGGGGDCFFHSVAAALEQMLVMNDAARNAVLRRFERSDFGQARGYLVRKLVVKRESFVG